MEETTKTAATTEKKSLGQKMIDHLKAVGKAKRRAGTATTEELAAIAGVSVSEAYSRCYWLAEKDGVLASVGGKGRTKVWRLAPRGAVAKKAK